MAQMNAEEKRAFRQMLNAAKNLIVADGKVDLAELRKVRDEFKAAYDKWREE